MPLAPARISARPGLVKTFSAVLVLSALGLAAAETPTRHPLDPRGRIHIPIGFPNTVDTLKTFVEAEGNFSPGFGSYGVYFWVWDAGASRLYAPTMDEVRCQHGLAPGGLLIPWSKWNVGQIEVKTEVCQAKRRVPTGPTLVDNEIPYQMQADLSVVGARVHLTNRGGQPAKLMLYAALRPLGPAGGPVREMLAGPFGLSVNGQPALQAASGLGVLAGRAGVLPNDTIGELALAGRRPTDRHASSESGDCSGALCFDLTLTPRATTTLGFFCPVLPGRRASGHRWDGVSEWAQFDLNKPNPAEGGLLQPDATTASFKVDDLFSDAAAYWRNLQQRVRLQLPDPRWAEAFAAMVGHAALCMNEGAPDVAAVNYNVFNRDGMYVANIFQKSGNFDLAETAIDYFLRHPFNGRVQPEADNPGQILWVMGEHWKFTRNRDWLSRVYPSVQKLAAMIRYYRTTPGPHWVCETSLDFGAALPKDRRKELKPGACDGFNPNYTEAYDIAGLRAAASLAEALPHIGSQQAGPADALAWRKLADELFTLYDQKFASDLPRGYGSYSVLWPCRLYPLAEGRAFEQFRNVGAQVPADWRYFPLARAHQGLLAGNRAAAWQTLDSHLRHEQMQGWYAFDEGGPSGVGGWHHVRSAWPIVRNNDGSPKSTVAMPHGWAIAEFQLLLRDALVYEEADRLVLLAGVPPNWFTAGPSLIAQNLLTHFGPCSFRYRVEGATATIELDSKAPGGCLLVLPAPLQPRVTLNGRALPPATASGLLLPPGLQRARLEFTKRPSS
jgi:hypothetical protein